MNIRFQSPIFLILPISLMLCGCGQKQPPVALRPKSVGTPLPAISKSSEGVPPPSGPPASPSPAATTASTAPKPVAGDEVAFYRPRDNQGNVASDLQVLNSALMAYGTDGVQRPPFHDLSDLVKAGLIKKLPPPPAGKKYVFDPKSGQAKLENQ